MANSRPIQNDRLLTRRQVEEEVQLSKAHIYALMRAGRFPKPLKISSRCVRWRHNEIQRFIAGHWPT